MSSYDEERQLLEQWLNLAEIEIKKEDFLKNEGNANEVGYYIFDYPASQEKRIREWVEYIRRKSERAEDEYRVVTFDLYDIMISVLEEKNYLDKCYDLEKKYGFEKLSKGIANLIKVNATDGLIVEYIRSRTPEKAVVMITGIGKCYPIIRSHTVLNNLHLGFDNCPVIMFYPGTYNGQELILFGEIKDDNYYRAFPLVDKESRYDH